jgi:mRNA-degrading endonuclease RelE of RelBE toxin-antitoxin system
MAWTYTFHPSFHADLKRMDLGLAQRILETLQRIQADPLRTMKRLKGSDLFSLRIGDYRVHALVYPGSRLVDFVRVGHRKNVHDI